MVEVLLGANASPIQKDGTGRDAYQYAVDSGRQLVALIIAEASAIYSIEADNMEEVLKSLQRGAYVNIRNSAGWTPTIYASARQDITALKEILKYGPDLNRTENDGWTALHFAASQGNVETARLLIENNANPVQRTVNGKTPRDIAIDENRSEILEFLPPATSPDL
jgi:ankyrin repeat protein